MKTNEAGRALIRRWESLKLSAYRCSAGKPTIGWGHTEGVAMGQVITAHQAEVLFDHDVEAVETQVSNTCISMLNENQFSALVSFVFNVGAVNWNASRLRKLVNRSLFSHAAEQFPLWVHARDPETKQLVRLEGLVNRRAAERALFLTPVKP